MEDKFCPILQRDCMSNCAWQVHDECAIHVIGRHFLDVPIGEIPEEFHFWKSQPIDTEAETDEEIQNGLG
jgi:hypothetical protein